jgi:uncharacterized protein YjbI with pentapeptide repeats
MTHGSNRRIYFCNYLVNMKLFYSTVGWTFLTATVTATQSLAADPQHVKQLEATGQCANCDLSGASFVGIDFSEAPVDLQNANLNGANFSGAIMTNGNFSGASAVGSSFLGANLQGATLKNTNLLFANLVKANLSNATVEKTNLYAANLAAAKLNGAKVTKTNFVGANIYKMQYSPILKQSGMGNSFQKAPPSSPIVLTPGATSQDQRIGDRTLESGSFARRRYRIPAWITNYDYSPAGAGQSRKRPPPPVNFGPPLNVVPASSRQWNIEEILRDILQ